MVLHIQRFALICFQEDPGWIELGYEPNTDTYVRVIDTGGIAWSGGHRDANPDENLQEMECALQRYKDK